MSESGVSAEEVAYLVAANMAAAGHAAGLGRGLRTIHHMVAEEQDDSLLESCDQARIILMATLASARGVLSTARFERGECGPPEAGVALAPYERFSCEQGALQGLHELKGDRDQQRFNGAVCDSEGTLSSVGPFLQLV